jgi:hypothetical protein
MTAFRPIVAFAGGAFLAGALFGGIPYIPRTFDLHAEVCKCDGRWADAGPSQPAEWTEYPQWLVFRAAPYAHSLRVVDGDSPALRTVMLGETRYFKCRNRSSVSMVTP